MTPVAITIALAVGVAAGPAPARGRGGEADRSRPIVRVDADPDGRYRVTIAASGDREARVAPRVSVPPPRVRWVSADLLRIDYGSELGADVVSIFYSARRNAVDGPHEFVKAVDPAGELALCAGADVSVVRLFGRRSVRIDAELPELSRAGLKWFVVSSRSRFEHGKLHVRYMAEPSDAGGERWLTRDVDLTRLR